MGVMIMIKRRKKKKYASEAQKMASERNWNKGQIRCIRSLAYNIQKANTTKLSEQLILSSIIHGLDKIDQNWTKSND